MDPAHDIDAGSVAEILGVTEAATAARLAAIDLTPAARELLRAAAPAVHARVDDFTALLYERFRAEPALAQLVASEAKVASLRRQQGRYLREMFGASIDRRYVLDRLRLGLMHHQLRITPPWYVATYSDFVCAHVDLLFAQAASSSAALEAVVALLKTVMFDAGLALQAYGYSEERTMWVGGGLSEPAAPAPRPSASPAPASPARPRETARLYLDEDVVAARRRFIGIGAAELAVLPAFEATVRRAAPAVMEDFYAWFSRQPETAAMMSEDVVARLKRQVSSYWHEIARADFGRPYAASRMRIGVVHERVGMPPHWYLAGLARQAAGFIRALPGDGTELVPLVKALVKAMFFDMSFVIDAYMDARVEALLRTEGFASHVVSNMVSAVAVLDAQGRIRAANRALLELLCVDPALLYMMPAEKAFELPWLTALLARSRVEPGRQVVEIAPIGGRTHRVTIMELRESGGDAAQRALVFDDVTGVIDYARHVERNVSGLEAVIEATRAIAWEMETPGGTMLSMSPTVLEVLGLRDMHFLGRGAEWTASIHEADRDEFVRARDELAQGARVELEHRMRCADGREIWVRSTLVRPHGPDGTRLVRGLTTDVTRLRHAQQRRAEAMLHAQRMEIVGRLAGGLAHDFNNTLTVIAANLEIAQAGVVDEDARACLRHALDAAQISGGLNRRLLSFARRDQGDAHPFQVNDRILGVATLIRPALGEDVSLRCELEEGLPPVHVAPADFDSAMLNLAINAREALPTGGTITLRTRLEGGGSGAAPVVCVRVEDDGVGMCPDTLAQASEAFFSTKTTPSNAGLGLHSVRLFVERSGGELAIESRLGVGTSVTLRLPAMAVSTPTAALATGSDPATIELGNGEVVIVVDRDESVQLATARLLEGLGYAVAPAQDGAEAIRMLEQGEPAAVVLCDASLGGGQGARMLAETLRRRWPAVAMLLTSGGQSADGLAAGATSDALPVLRKPYTRARLAAALRACLQPEIGGSVSTSPEKT